MLISAFCHCYSIYKLTTILCTTTGYFCVHFRLSLTKMPQPFKCNNCSSSSNRFCHRSRQPEKRLRLPAEMRVGGATPRTSHRASCARRRRSCDRSGNRNDSWPRRGRNRRSIRPTRCLRRRRSRLPRHRASSPN